MDPTCKSVIATLKFPLILPKMFDGDQTSSNIIKCDFFSSFCIFSKISDISNASNISSNIQNLQCWMKKCWMHLSRPLVPYVFELTDVYCVRTLCWKKSTKKPEKSIKSIKKSRKTQKSKKSRTPFLQVLYPLVYCICVIYFWQNIKNDFAPNL